MLGLATRCLALAALLVVSTGCETAGTLLKMPFTSANELFENDAIPLELVDLDGRPALVFGRVSKDARSVNLETFHISDSIDLWELDHWVKEGEELRLKVKPSGGGTIVGMGTKGNIPRSWERLEDQVKVDWALRKARALDRLRQEARSERIGGGELSEVEAADLRKRSVVEAVNEISQGGVMPIDWQ